MIEVQGKYCTAKVYTDNIEEAAYRQVLNLMNQPFASGSNCAIMPDVHAGVGCVIGLTAKITDKVVPNLVGVDIGCGMLVVMVDSSFKFDLHKVDEIIREGIPAGMKVRDTRHKFDEVVDEFSIDNPNHLKDTLAEHIEKVKGNRPAKQFYVRQKNEKGEYEDLGILTLSEAVKAEFETKRAIMITPVRP